ncbi:permease prefix domain 1-containing protein [Streptomyces albulus]|nr:permease prefix domain 1-containing protein [Streptomyces noursei]
MSTSSLTERYVDEVVRRLPAAQRDDIGEELRTTIADTVEAREAADPQSAEREVLTEMGDPVRYAARYTGRPLALIGPDLYPAYIRLLVLLLSSVLPVITTVSVLVELADSGDVGAAVGEGVTTVLTLGAQMIAVLTVVFALVDRLRSRDGAPARSAAWTLADLPEPRKKDKVGIMDALGAAWYALLISLTVWQHVAKPYGADGHGGGKAVEVLDPALWSGWIWPVLLGLAAMLALSAARITVRGWTVRLAALNTVAQAVFALPFAWILQHRMLFNPEFLKTAGTDALTQEVYSGLAVIVLVLGASAVVTGFRSARR